MKLVKYLTGLMVVLMLTSATMFAQEDLSMDEWKSEMGRLTTKKESLTTELAELKANIETTKAALEEAKAAKEDCEKAIYAMIGTDEAGVDNFRKKVDALEGKINRKEVEKEDRQAELDELKESKISALPEFYNKVHNLLQRKLDAWVVAPKEVMYTVVKGDHLWGIAKKSDHYGNGFAWPVIYKANRDQIKNPDLIYPQQVFKVPNLSDDEKAKYEKIKRNYKPAPADM